MSIRGEVLFLAHKNATRCIGDPKQNLVNSGGRDWANWSNWWELVGVRGKKVKIV